MPMTTDQADAARRTARALLEIGAVDFNPAEPFTLTSGRVSPVYIDCRKVISYPRERAELMDLAVALIEREIGPGSLDSVAGGETAGIPFAAWIAERMGLPMLYVRKKPKGFGRMAQIEGHMPEGARVLLVEDLATDGASKVHFCTALGQAGARVAHALVVFHYGIFPKGVEALEKMGVRLHALATWWDVLAAAEEGHYLDPAALKEIESYLKDPEGWAAARPGA
jgi:orotate phosphoribosyltransferase